MTNHVVELIPWYVNGRLSPEDRMRLSAHLQDCSRCNRELNLQRQIYAAVNTSGKVEIAPQPSFNKLWNRIVTEETESETALLQPRQSNGVSMAIKQLMQWIGSRWMPFTLVVQTVGIAMLVLVIITHASNRNENTANLYRTVTSSAPSSGTVIHVVFDDATRLVDIKDILLRSGLQVVTGPTLAGVYALSPAGKQADFDAQTAVRALRDDPRVRFAELSHQ